MEDIWNAWTAVDSALNGTFEVRKSGTLKIHEGTRVILRRDKKAILHYYPERGVTDKTESEMQVGDILELFDAKLDLSTSS